MPISNYSTTPANNDSAVPYGAPEGWAPASVNNVIRQIMADVRAWFEDAQWINYGDTPNYVSATSFSVPTDRTSVYVVDRRIQATVSAGTVVGAITGASYDGSATTTVTVALDSGSLDSGLSVVSLGSVLPTNDAIPHTGMGLPPGAVIQHAGALPSGFLECDGSAVSRSTYARLFTSLGTTWGSGDGSTTFNLPDFRGRALIGNGTGSGLTARTLGQTGGEETHALSVGEMPSHNHGGTTGTTTTSPKLGVDGSAGSGTYYVTIGSSTGNAQAWTTNAIQGSSHNHSVASEGSGTGHNIMQPFAVLRHIIKH